MYKAKTERDLVYEGNKDIIRAIVRFEASTYYKRKSNLLLEQMTEKFLDLEAQGIEYKLTPDLSPELAKAIEQGVDEILSRPLELTA